MEILALFLAVGAASAAVYDLSKIMSLEVKVANLEAEINRLRDERYAKPVSASSSQN